MTVGVSGQGDAVARRRPFGLTLPRALDLTERALCVFTFIFWLIANFQGGSRLSIAFALTDFIAVFFILLRKPTDSVSLSPSDWAVAILGSTLGMLARPGGHPLMGPAAPTFFWTWGLAVSIAAKLSLNRRFGAAPANRGVQAHGMYAFVRHPMYAGYFWMNAAYLLINPTYWNLGLYAVVWVLQFARIHREESWLKRDPAYQAYMKQVRCRLIPFVV